MGEPYREPLPRIPGFEVHRELGRGGMGAVYEATSLQLGRRVALKLLRPAGEDPEGVLRFQREAEAYARLSHPGIVGVHSVARAGDWLYMELELVEGESLAQRLREGGPFAPERAARAALRLARAVQHAHERGVLHRDLKPANVLLTPAGEPRVVDFGLTRATEAGANQLTASGDVLGTPAWMAPEQARGERARIDERTDVYGLGAVLYAMLTEGPPVTERSASVTATLLQVVQSAPTPPSRLQRGVDAELEAICLRCLEKDPGARYPSAEAVAEALERYVAGGALGRGVGRAGRSVLGLVGLASLGVFGALALGSLGESGEEASRAGASPRRTAEEPEEEGGARGGGDPPASAASPSDAAPDLEDARRWLRRGREHLGGERWRDAAESAAEARRLLDGAPGSSAKELRREAARSAGLALARASRRRLDCGLSEPVELEAVAVSRDGRLLAVGRSDGCVGLWGLREARRLRLLEPEDETGEVESCAFLSGEQLLVAHETEANPESCWRVWDVSSGDLLGQRRLSSNDVVASPSREHRVAAAYASVAIIRDLRPGSVEWEERRRLHLRSAGVPEMADGVAFSHDGERLLVSSGRLGGRRGHIYVFDLGEDEEPLGLMETPDHVDALLCSGDVLAATDGNVCRVWEVGRRKLLEQRGVRAVALGPRGRPVVLGREHRRSPGEVVGVPVVVWDPREDEPRRANLAPQPSEPEAYAFSPEGRHLLVAAERGIVDVYRAEPLTSRTWGFEDDPRRAVRRLLKAIEAAGAGE